MQGERKSPWAVLLILAVIGLLLLYPLSIGPVVWMLNHRILNENSLVIGAYAPLEWAAERSPRFSAGMGRYVDLWDGPDLAIPADAPLPYVPPPPLPMDTSFPSGVDMHDPPMPE